MNERQQSAFRDALSGEASFVPNTTYINDSVGYDFETITPFRSHDYIRYNSELYQIQLQQGQLYASYTVQAVRGSPDGAAVVEFDSLPADIQDEVKTAITDGEYNAPMGKWYSLPEPLRDAEYVRYENQTYEMTYVIGDAWSQVLTVEKVD